MLTLRSKNPVDKLLVANLAILLSLGVLIFASASLGLLARGTHAVSSMVANHLIFGVLLGLIVAYVVSMIKYQIWKEYAFYLYGLSVFATALVFVPHIGLEILGAHRWIHIGSFTIQPSEFLKVGVLLALAAYFTRYKSRVNDFRWGLGGFALILLPPTALLLAQPDNGTLGIILFSAGAMYLAAGARVRDIAILVLGGILMLSIVLFVRPYALDRMTTFLDPSKDPLTTGYQLRQSLIAVGSGGVFGRGFGQSIQKFNYLPEPVSDSIFAVAAEEFGILGAVVLIALYMLFAARGLFIATRTPDYFGALLAVGITVYIVMQAFINIASMIGVMPMTGVPLLFVSHGGTAMLTALGAVGILLSISRRSQQS